MDGEAFVPTFDLIVPETPLQLEAARDILAEYARTLQIDPAFLSMDEELSTLPGSYAWPQGVLLLALLDDAVAGCGAIRPLLDADQPNACELKRLYVRRSFRRLGLGRTLMQALLDHAQKMGYSTMLLDTLDDMEAARELYASLGFQPIPPYYYNPIPGAHYLKADLAKPVLQKLIWKGR